LRAEIIRKKLELLPAPDVVGVLANVESGGIQAKQPDSPESSGGELA
jgi:hypothetical protein